MFYSSNKYNHFISWCQFRSHCFMCAPDVTWFTSHWLPSLILPTAVVTLPSCDLLVLPDTSPSPPKLLQHPSHLLHSFSCSYGFLPLSSSDLSTEAAIMEWAKESKKENTKKNIIFLKIYHKLYKMSKTACTHKQKILETEGSESL